MAEERRKNDWEQSLTVVTDQTHHIVVAPVVQCSFCNLSEKGGGEESEGGRGEGRGGEGREEETVKGTTCTDHQHRFCCIGVCVRQILSSN